MIQDNDCICGNKAFKDGFCKDCLKKQEEASIKFLAEKKTRDELKQKNMRHCKIKGCGKKHLAKGLCESHYKKEWHQSPVNREYQKKYKAKYNKTEKYLAWRRKYAKTPKQREHNRKYQQKYALKKKHAKECSPEGRKP